MGGNMKEKIETIIKNAKEESLLIKTCRKITYTIKYMPDDNKFTAEDVNNWTSLLKSKMEEKIQKSR